MDDTIAFYAFSTRKPVIKEMVNHKDSAPAPLRFSVWQALFLLGVSLLVYSTLTGIIGSFSLAPVWDEWAEVLWLKGFYAGHWHISDLWRQHNEHRILLPRLFLLTDWLVFRGTRVFVLVSILIAQALTARLVIRAAWPALSRQMRIFYAGTVIAFLFSAAQMENFAIPFQIQLVLAFLLASAAIASLVHAVDALGAGGARRVRWWFISCIAAATGSTWSFASGLFIWPTLILLTLALRLRFRWLLAMVLAAAANVAFYLRGYQNISNHQLSLRNPIAVGSFMSGLLALPIGRLQHLVGVGCGFAGVLFTGWLVLRLFLDREKTPTLFFSGMMVFLVASACATAIGRAALGVPEAPNNTRYITWGSLFLVCVAGVLLTDDRLPFAQHKGKNAAVITGIIACLLMAILPAHLDARDRFEYAGKLARESSLALIANVCDADRIRPVFPDTTLACGSVEFFREHHFSIFAQEYAREIGTPLQNHYHVVDQKSCAGVYESHDAVAAVPDRPGMSMIGWAWDVARNRRPERVVFADAQGTIRGIARFSRTRTDLPGSFFNRNPKLEDAGWFGYVQPGAAGTYRAYAVLSGNSACPLESLADRKTALPGIFRNGEWFIDTNKNGTIDPEDQHFSLGTAGDIPILGDWDGSGRLKAGVFRNGAWLVDWNGNNRWDDGDRIFNFGQPGDIPVVCDWNHTGVQRIGVFRNGTWLLDWNNNHQWDSEDKIIAFGVAGDLPVVGDWDGTGVKRIGIYRGKGEWYLDMDGDLRFIEGVDKKIPFFGLPGDRPAPGNWLGFGRSYLGIMRDGAFYLDWNGSAQWDEGDRILPMGQTGDYPVVW